VSQGNAELALITFTLSANDHVLWNAVRFIVDQRKSRGQFILTGFVVPKMAKNMHSGAGRFSRLTMRTMSLFESNDSTDEISLADLFNGKTGLIGTSKLTIDDLAYVLLRGGWPETVKEKNAEAVMQTVFDYVEAIINDDTSCVDGKKRKPARVRGLLRSVARHVSSPVNNSTIAIVTATQIAHQRDDGVWVIPLGCLKN